MTVASSAENELDTTADVRDVPGIRWRLLAVCTLAALSFWLRYISDPMRPGAIFSLGWYEQWFDQTQYYDILVHIPQGTLGGFQYPFLYPFLGVLGQLVGSAARTYARDPFFFVDACLFLVYIGFAHRIFERFVSPALAICATVVLTQVSVGDFVTPWTTTVSATALMLLLDIFTRGAYTARNGVVAGLAAASMFGARIGDVVPAAVVGLYFFFDSRGSRGDRSRFLISAVAAAALVAGIIAFVNFRFSGHLLGNYFNSIVGQGFTLVGIPLKLYGYFLDPFIFYRESHPLSTPVVTETLFVLVAPLGLFLLLRDLRYRAIGITFCLAAAGWLMLYGPYVPVTGPTLKNHSLHYFKLMLPVVIGAGFFAAATLGKIGTHSVDARVRRIFVSYLVLLLFVVAGVRFFPFSKFRLSPTMLSGNTNASELGKMIDGSLATRWDSAKPQEPGMEFVIDLGTERFVHRITMDTAPSPNDYPRELSVSYSIDGKNWGEWPASNQSVSAPMVDLISEMHAVRWLRFRQHGTTGFYWSVHELAVYGW